MAWYLLKDEHDYSERIEARNANTAINIATDKAGEYCMGKIKMVVPTKPPFDVSAYLEV